MTMTDEPIYQGRKGWVCPICKQARGKDGHDPCLATLPGVKYACCGHGGHGQNSGYIYFENGIRVGVIVTDVSYEDGRSSVIVPGVG